ncbi:MAG: hypothetical protein ABSF91_09350 [Bacteroidota bacterium]|jgi:hypothetical protein
MNRRTTLLLAFVLSSCPVHAAAKTNHPSITEAGSDSAQHAGPPSSGLDGVYPSGLSTSIGVTKYYSSLSDYSLSIDEYEIGMGYNISPGFLVGLKIFTGTERIGAANATPVAGTLALGGGEIEITHRFSGNSIFRPTAGVALELATVLKPGNSSGQNTTGGGYNGRGLSIQAGGEYYVSRNMSFAINVIYTYREYRDLILGGEFRGTPNTGIDRMIGLSLSGLVHYDFLP